jgi:molecular chaperone GrpE
LKRVLAAPVSRLAIQNPILKNLFSSMSEPKQPEQNQQSSGSNDALTGAPSPEELEAAAAANEHEAITELAVAQAEVATLQAKNTELADSYLRAKAESENARRRADEEVSKARKFALESFAESLLPVADSLEAGLNLPSATPEQIKEGAAATLKQLKAALERNRVMQIDPAAGTKFDPHQHQAISVVPSEQEANTVVTVLQKGYLIADRVLRPALVTVSAPK